MTVIPCYLCPMNLLFDTKINVACTFIHCRGLSCILYIAVRHMCVQTASLACTEFILCFPLDADVQVEWL